MAANEEQKLREYFDQSQQPIHKAIVAIGQSHTIFKQREDTSTTTLRTNEWKGKPLHGRIYHNLHNENIDAPASCTYL